mmetsp:Transcript_48998/g.151324  ORF Transcript_48998/g.151324 Transcript_48998/m.151324 type:complete len:235 (-) Transcript_48998:432-1136(-)
MASRSCCPKRSNFLSRRVSVSIAFACLTLDDTSSFLFASCICRSRRSWSTSISACARLPCAETSCCLSVSRSRSCNSRVPQKAVRPSSASLVIFSIRASYAAFCRSSRISYHSFVLATVCRSSAFCSRSELSSSSLMAILSAWRFMCSGALSMRPTESIASRLISSRLTCMPRYSRRWYERYCPCVASSSRCSSASRASYSARTSCRIASSAVAMRSFSRRFSFRSASFWKSRA